MPAQRRGREGALTWACSGSEPCGGHHCAGPAIAANLSACCCPGHLRLTHPRADHMYAPSLVFGRGGEGMRGCS